MSLFLTGKPIDVLILTYNRLEYVSYCLGSLISNTSYPMNIVVVDNASEDGTREYLSSLKNKGMIQHLILNEENQGIAVAKNQGVECFQWEEDYCIVTDSDITFPKITPSWIEMLNQTMVRHPKLGILSPDCDPINAPMDEQKWWWEKRQFKKDDLAIIPTGFWGAMIRKEVIDKLDQKNNGEIFKCRSLYGETDEQFRGSIQKMGYWCGVCTKVMTYNLGWDDKRKNHQYHVWKKKQRWRAEEARRAEGIK